MSLNLNDDLYIESGNTSAQDIPLGANQSVETDQVKTTDCSLASADKTAVTDDLTLSDTGGSGGGGSSTNSNTGKTTCFQCAVNAVSNSAVYGAGNVTENETVISCPFDGSSSPSSTTTNYYYFTFNVSPSSATISYNFGDNDTHYTLASSGDTVCSSAKTLYYSASVLGYETVTGWGTNYQTGKTNAIVLTNSVTSFTGYTFNVYVSKYTSSKVIGLGGRLSGVSIYEGMRANKLFLLATTSSDGSATFTSTTSNMILTLVKDGYITQTETLTAGDLGYFLSMVSPYFTLPNICDTSSGNPLTWPITIQSGNGSTFWTGSTTIDDLENFKSSLNNYIAKDSYPTDLTAIISAHHFTTRECSVEFTGPSSAKTVTFDSLTDVVMERQQKVCMTWEDFGFIFDKESETEDSVGADLLNKVIINGKVDDSTYLGEYVSEILDGVMAQVESDDEVSDYLLTDHDVIFYDNNAWDIADKKGLVFEYCFLPNTSLWLTITQGQSHTLNCSAQTGTSTVYSSSNWTASTTASWITVSTTTGAAGTNNLSFSVTAAATGSGNRTGTITVKNDNFTRDISVTQALAPQTVSKYGSYNATKSDINASFTYSGAAFYGATDETLVAAITFERTAGVSVFNCPSATIQNLAMPSIGDPYIEVVFTLRDKNKTYITDASDAISWNEISKNVLLTMSSFNVTANTTYYLYAKMRYGADEGNVGSFQYNFNAHCTIISGTYEYTYES